MVLKKKKVAERYISDKKRIKVDIPPAFPLYDPDNRQVNAIEVF